MVVSPCFTYIQAVLSVDGAKAKVFESLPANLDFDPSINYDSGTRVPTVHLLTKMISKG